MAQSLTDERVEFAVGDIRDRNRLFQVMEGVDIVVHAAALKQVPAGERNPSEPIKTNIDGAINLIETARACGVERIVALSTDKAVQPVNLYGATKLVAEKLFIAANPSEESDDTRMSIVRYGNVVGSRGSVIPAFLRQCSRGVVTLTDPRMTRFWITLEEGVRFVFRALEAMRGGEIFVPKLPTARITDLIEAIAPKCKRKMIGIRPGEKVHEVLVGEAHRACKWVQRALWRALETECSRGSPDQENASGDSQVYEVDPCRRMLSIKKWRPCAFASARTPTWATFETPGITSLAPGLLPESSSMQLRLVRYD